MVSRKQEVGTFIPLNFRHDIVVWTKMITECENQRDLTLKKIQLSEKMGK